MRFIVLVLLAPKYRNFGIDAAEFHVGVLLDGVAQVTRRVLAADVDDEGLDVRRAAVAGVVLIVGGDNELEPSGLPRALLATSANKVPQARCVARSSVFFDQGWSSLSSEWTPTMTWHASQTDAVAGMTSSYAYEALARIFIHI